MKACLHWRWSLLEVFLGVFPKKMRFISRVIGLTGAGSKGSERFHILRVLFMYLKLMSK